MNMFLHILMSVILVRASRCEEWGYSGFRFFSVHNHVFFFFAILRKNDIVFAPTFHQLPNLKKLFKHGIQSKSAKGTKSNLPTGMMNTAKELSRLISLLSTTAMRYRGIPSLPYNIILASSLSFLKNFKDTGKRAEQNMGK